MLANTLLAGPGLVDQLGPGLQELVGPGQPVAERGEEHLGPAGSRTKPDPDEGKNPDGSLFMDLLKRPSLLWTEFNLL